MKILSVVSLCPNQDPNPAFRSVISLLKLTCMVKLCKQNVMCAVLLSHGAKTLQNIRNSCGRANMVHR